MSTPPEHPAPDRTRWTGEKAAAFLKALARSGKVAAAARSVGMSREAAYRLRARAPQFAALWCTAMAAAEAQRAAARRRRKPVHPLLAREVTPPPRDVDTLARRASHLAPAQSHIRRGN